MYQLYLGASTAGFVPHVLLREIGAPFELKFLDIEAGEHRQPPYLAINPFGRVPALVVHGETLAETAAIALWLADQHPDAGLAPAPDAPERRQYLQWMQFLASTLHGVMLTFFYPQRYTADENGSAAVRQAAEHLAGEWFAHADRHLAAHGPYVLGERFSAVDVYLFMLVRWGRWFAAPPSGMAGLAPFMQRVFERPAVRRAFEVEGVTERFY